VGCGLGAAVADVLGVGVVQVTTGVGVLDGGGGAGVADPLLVGCGEVDVGGAGVGVLVMHTTTAGVGGDDCR
jgi:hypothetical protein